MSRVIAAFVLVLSAVGAQQWVSALPKTDLFFANAVYDAARNRVVICPSEGGTWELDGSRLLQRVALQPVGALDPGPREAAAMVYDAARQRVVLFGGSRISGQMLADTWSWDGITWRLLSIDSAMARSGTALAFDSSRGRIVLFGGWNGSSGLTDTWEHDGIAWQPQSPAIVPTALFQPCMAFDSTRAVTVLHGGGPGTASGTWEWNGQNWAAVDLSSAQPGSGVSLAFDPTRNRTVAFGGQNDTGIWEWNGSSWSRPSELPFAAHHGCSAWYDTSNGAIRFGGGPLGTGTTDLGVHEWRGATLTPVRTATTPLGRFQPACFSDRTGGLILFGGQAGASAPGDTWRWDGSSWRQLSVPGPSARDSASVATDAVSGISYLFGGDIRSFPPTDDFWKWDGIGWTQLPNGPTPRRNAGMCFDSVRNQVVLFGGRAVTGQLIGDTWIWNGTNWLQASTPLSPGARVDHAMAFDETTGKAMLYGGDRNFTRESDTWLWDGTQWTPWFGGQPLLLPQLVGDPANGRMLLFGFPVPATARTPVTPRVFASSNSGWSLLLQEPATIAYYRNYAVDRSRGNPIELTAGLRELTMQPAIVATSGPGCGTPAPSLTLRSRPRSGELDCGLELRAAQFAPMVIGLDAITSSVQLGPGCAAEVGGTAQAFFGVTDGRGFAELLTTVPMTPSLRQFPLFAQAIALDATQPLGFSLTNGVRFQIGD